MLYCKQGDLAVIVRSAGDNGGKIVRCVSLLPALPFRKPDGTIISGPAWVVDPHVVGWDGDRLPGVRDVLLRPLRDSDGEDEMLQLVGRPEDSLVGA